jgi:hypothetical protein
MIFFVFFLVSTSMGIEREEKKEEGLRSNTLCLNKFWSFKSSSKKTFYFYFIFWCDWGLSSVLCTWKAGTTA